MVDFAKLCESIQHSRKRLEFYRVQRAEMVREYVGAHYAENGAKQMVPVNLISLYVSVVSRNLIAKNPRVMLSSQERYYKASVSAMQSWANKRIEAMCLGNTLQRVVLDALFSVGIAKVALATPADAANFAWNLQAGQAYVERVDLDDFVYDTRANDFNEVGFIGHRYRAPMEVVRGSEMYGPERFNLTPSQQSRYNQEGDERIGAIGREDYTGNQDDFEEFVDLWEVYLPRHRLVLTLSDDFVTGGAESGVEGFGAPLRTQPWLGSDHGPYHLLSYGTVPGNAMPKAPIQDLVDLHCTVNNLYRKLIRQAERQKENLLIMGGALEDGSRIQEANDGDIIRCDNPDKAVPRVHGGPNQQNFAMAVALKDLFTYMAGNLDMMGGLAPQSKTLGQDRMLNENASRGVSDMQDRTIDYTASVLKSLCWYWWHDPMTTMKTTYSLAGLPSMEIPRQVTAEQRNPEAFESLCISVDPYSMQHATPQTRMGALQQVMQTVLLPMTPVLQQQGIAVDINAYLKMMASYMDMPDLSDLTTIQEAPAREGSTPADDPKMPTQTNRSYTRENVSSRTPQATDANLISSLMGLDAGGENGQSNGQMNGAM